MSFDILKKSTLFLLSALLCLTFAEGAMAAEITNVASAQELAAVLANPESGDITLTNDISMNAVSNDIPITRSVRIFGSGKALDGVNQYRIFTLLPGANVIFENVLFRNARPNSGNGGAVNILAGTATFNTGSFVDNVADKGGAVSVAPGTTVKFNGTSFTSNAAADGGALHIAGTGKVDFVGSVSFSNNHARGSGGAVYLDGAVAAFPSTTSFTNNVANKGGALALSSTAKATLSGNAISANTAADGGAVHLPAGAVLSFAASTAFQNNEATDKGGAIYADALSLVPTGGVKVTFTGNKATGTNGAGGAIYTAGRAMIGGGVEFIDNTSATNGGAVYSVGKVEASGGAFEGNRAAANGGAIYTADSAVLSGGTFEDNRAETNGGAVFTAADAEISGGTFKGNKAGDSGGAIYATGTATITGGNFQAGNEAKGTTVASGGGAVRADKIFVRPSGASLAIEAQSTQGSGGALHATTELAVEKSVFRGNKAKESGGALYSAGTIILKDSLLENNEVTDNSGGAIFSEGASTVTNCAFNRNAAKVGGGAIASRGRLLLFDSSLIENSAESGKYVTRGGAVALQPGAGISSEVRRCLFKSNKASAEGGAIYYESSHSSSLLAVESSIFSSNQILESDLGGGALYVRGSGKIDASTFSNNTVDTAPSSSSSGKGGAVTMDVRPDGKAILNNCTFAGNATNSFQGDGLGGALYLNGESALLHCTFTGENRAGARDKNKNGLGGGIYLESGPLTITATALAGNQASIGNDIFAQAGVKIFSGGYNRLGLYGNRSSGGPVSARWRTDPNIAGDTANDQEGLQALDLFGPNTLADNDDGSGIPPTIGSTILGGAAERLQTVALQTLRPNPALDQIPTDKGKTNVDARGLKRPQPYPDGNLDVGAFECPGGSLPPDPDKPVVGAVRMSEIPNTMVQIGQTTSLVAVVTDQGGKVLVAAPVAWKSSNPRVARIDQNGNLVSLSMGKTVISVSTVAHTAFGGPATDSATLVVSEEMSYTNVHPEIWRRLGIFNEELDAYGSALSFVPADPNRIGSPSFEGPFKSVWGADPTQVDKLLNPGAVDFFYNPTLKPDPRYGDNVWRALKPSIGFRLSGQKNGALLPLRFTWFLTRQEINQLLGRPVTNVTLAELFSVLGIAFQAADGTIYLVVDADGKYGVAAAQAIKSALQVRAGINGLSLELVAYMGDLRNVAGPGGSLPNTRPQLIDGLLVLPDGLADSTLSGSMWLLQKVVRPPVNPVTPVMPGIPLAPGGGSGGGGGGGCNAGASSLLILAAAGFALRLSRRKDIH